MKQYTSLWLVCLLAVFSMTARAQEGSETKARPDYPALPFMLTFEAPAEGSASLSISADGETLTSPTTLHSGTEVTITVTPADGYRMASGYPKVYRTGTPSETVPATFKPDASSGIAYLYTFTMPDFPVTVEVEYEKIQSTVTFANPANGTLTLSTADAPGSSIVSGGEVASGTKVTIAATPFNVTKNETAEKREAIIEVSYADIQPAPSFTVKQAARPEEAFTITISDITTKTFRTTVRPGDQEMYYLLNIIPSRAAADFKTDDELYQYDIDFYTDMDATGSGWQSWAQEYLKQGTIADRLIENMEPDTEYLVYAYGVDPITIERLTPISKKTLTTLAPQTIDTKFDIQIVSTEGLNIDVLVKANDYDGHFVAKIYGSVDAADTDATVLEKISESWIDNVKIYGWMGYTAEMILSQYTFQQSREIQETLEPNSKYYIYAFAVDDEALRCSDIVFIPITTNDTSIQH